MKPRSAPLVAALTIFSLGFYGIHWFAEKKEFIESKGLQTPSFLPLGFFTFLLPVAFIADLLLQSQFAIESQKIGSISLWVLLGLALTFVLVYAHWASAFNKVLDGATSGQLNNKLVCLPLGLGFIGFASLQSRLNQSLAGQPVAPASAAPMASAPVAAAPQVYEAQSAVMPPVSTGSDWQKGIATIQPEISAAEVPPEQMSGETKVPPQAGQS